MKGVSPVVATVLILAIAVMASVAVWYWVSSLTGKPSTPTPQSSITVVSCHTTTTMTTLDITNNGGRTVGAYFDIYYVDNGTKVGAASVALSDLAAGDSATVDVTGAVLEEGTQFLLRTQNIPDVKFTCG